MMNDKMGGDGEMMEEQNQGSDQSYLEQCISKLDEMISNPKLMTTEGLQEIKSMLEEHESKMNEEESPNESSEGVAGRMGRMFGKGKMALLALLFIIGTIGITHAERKYTYSSTSTIGDWDSLPRGCSLIYSTGTASVGLTNNQINFSTNIPKVSTYAAIVRGVNIETPGSVDARVDIYNVNTATFISGAQMYMSIIATQTVSLPYYDLYFDSGIAAISYGTVPPKYSITYKEK